MKICFLGDVRSIHVQKFVKWFANKGHETNLISLDYRGDERVQDGLNFFHSINTPVWLLPKRYLPLVPAAARDIIHKLNPDIVQCHFITNYGFIGAFSGVHPLVIMAMGDDILIHPSRPLLGRAVRYALKRADHVLCDGENSIRELLRLGVPGNKIDLAYPGVDMILFNPDKREEFISKTVICPRGFDAIYDVDTLLEVIELVIKELPHGVLFLLAGVGTEYEHFKRNIRKKHLSKYVIFLGSVDNKKIPEYFASSDVSITCSLSDGGIPTSTIEALACGVPVVSTDAGDARIWIKDWCNGFVVAKGDAKTMSEWIILLLKISPCGWKEFSKNARRSVEHKQNYANNMQKVEEIYSRLLGRDL